MAQESWKIDKDETDCELLKPPSSSAAPVPAAAPPSPAMRSKSPPAAGAHPVTGRAEAQLADAGGPPEQAPVKVESLKAARCMNRCTSCWKKVGLTGFRCRCGELFCGRHRYSDTHDCSFDYKAAGREAIAKANPVVRAAKIIKI